MDQSDSLTPPSGCVWGSHPWLQRLLASRLSKRRLVSRLSTRESRVQTSFCGALSSCIGQTVGVFCGCHPALLSPMGLDRYQARSVVHSSGEEIRSRALHRVDPKGQVHMVGGRADQS